LKRAIIFANGTVPQPQAASALIQPDDLLIAADGGLSLALALGLTPHVIIGDMDSASREDVARARDQGAELELFPRDKDQTDLELALRSALDQGCDFVLIIGGLGGRSDQSLANVLLLADPALVGIDIRLDDGVEEAFITRGYAEVTGRAGDIVSLLPLTEPAEGIATDGLRYPLNGETLWPYQTRGVSNEMTGERAAVRVEKGLLICIHRRAGAGG
jgi:thiamine pyrophosphokinase